VQRFLGSGVPRSTLFRWLARVRGPVRVYAIPPARPVPPPHPLTLRPALPPSALFGLPLF
jgi:hypothetical protein